MDRKGQLSVEYLLAIILLSLIGLAIFTAFEANDTQVLRTTERLYMKALADDVASSINSVVIMGDGSQKLITLANSTLSGRRYNITLRDNLVLLQWGNISDIASRFSTTRLNTTKFNLTLPNMTNITVDEVRLMSGDILVWKENGTIFLQNVQI